MPPEHQTFKQAQRVKRDPEHAQGILFGSAEPDDIEDTDDEADDVAHRA